MILMSMDAVVMMIFSIICIWGGLAKSFE
ncbi:MetS family NSS transporter small subunit [Heyndrickxia sporothermodurans]